MSSSRWRFQYGLQRLLFAVALVAVAIKAVLYFATSPPATERIRFQLNALQDVEIFASDIMIGMTNRDLDLTKILNRSNGKEGFLVHRQNEDGSVTFLLNGDLALRFVSKDGDEVKIAKQSITYESSLKLCIFRLNTLPGHKRPELFNE